MFEKLKNMTPGEIRRVQMLARQGQLKIEITDDEIEKIIAEKLKEHPLSHIMDPVAKTNGIPQSQPS